MGYLYLENKMERMMELILIGLERTGHGIQES